MISRYYRAILIVVALGAFVSVPMVNAYPTAAGNVSDAAKQGQILYRA